MRHRFCRYGQIEAGPDHVRPVQTGFCVRAAAKTGEVSRAAVEFSVPRSALNAWFRQRETLFGMELFERRPSGEAPTPAGLRVLPYASAG